MSGIHFDCKNQPLVRSNQEDRPEESVRWVPLNQVSEEEYKQYFEMMERKETFSSFEFLLKEYKTIPFYFFPLELRMVADPHACMEYLKLYDMKSYQKYQIPLMTEVLRRDGKRYEMKDLFVCPKIEGEMPGHLTPIFKEFEIPFENVSREMASLILLNLYTPRAWWIENYSYVMIEVQNIYYDWVATENGHKPRDWNEILKELRLNVKDPWLSSYE